MLWKLCRQFKLLSETPESAKKNSNLTKVFIDTNVWFSAFYKSINADKILKAHINKKFQTIFNQQVLDELVKNIKLKIPRAIKPLQIFLESAPPAVIKNPSQIDKTVSTLANIKDHTILQSAVDCGANFLCTGNLKHFNGKKIFSRFNLQVISPAQMVKLFKL